MLEFEGNSPVREVPYVYNLTSEEGTDGSAYHHLGIISTPIN